MPQLATIPCCTCGTPVTDLASRLEQRRIQNGSGKIYCPNCREYGGTKQVRCAKCKAEFEIRIPIAELGTLFRHRPRYCPECNASREGKKALRCHWCGDVATSRSGDLIPGKPLGACRKPRCREELSKLMAGGAVRWADLTALEVGNDLMTGFVDPYFDLAAESWGRTKEMGR